MKPFAIMEQDWKIDWSSDIWLANNNAVETSSTVCIQYKKTQLKNTPENKHWKYIKQMRMMLLFMYNTLSLFRHKFKSRL